MRFDFSTGRGIVREFEEESGIGSIEADDGRSIPFHCIVIADNSRTIQSGAPVFFSLFAATRGRLEARLIEKL